MSKERTKEPQYQVNLDLRDTVGSFSLGLMANHVWYGDPRRLGFVLARYKFVSKMFSGLNRVLEVGCADAFATRLVQQEVGAVVATDFDPIFIEDAKQHVDPRWPLECRTHDMLNGPIAENFDGAYAMDVLEHIAPENEDAFLRNMTASLNGMGVMIIGMPSLSSQRYASEASKIGHVNCKDGPELKRALQRYFHNVFIFSMNDEVLHTGFYPMAHYLLALGSFRKGSA